MKMKNINLRGVIYARYSDAHQREESIEGQIRECKEYAKREGITIVSSYIDRAISGKTDNRPEFQKMIKDSAKGQFDVALVWKLDRFARNRYDSAQNKAILRKNGVRVVSATEAISDDSTGILLESLLEGYAEFYSAELSEKVLRGMTENALKLKYNGGSIAIGYIIDENQHYQLDPVTSPLVKLAFTRYDKGATIQEITDELRAKGLKSFRGNPLNFNNVTRILSNRRYTGEYKFRDHIVPNGIPAIVPMDLFERVQRRLAKNAKAPARYRAEDRYILSGKLRCGRCGALFLGESGQSKTGKIHHYYKCGDAKRRKGCKKKAVKKAWIEDIVIDQVQKIIFDDELLLFIAETLLDYQTRSNVHLPLLRQQLAEVEKGIKNMLDAIQAGIFTSTTKERLEELENSKRDLGIQIAQEELQNPTLTKGQILFFLSKFRELDMTNPNHRQRLIDSFVNAVFLYDDKIVFTFNYKDGAGTLELKDLEGSNIESLPAPNSHGEITYNGGIPMPDYKAMYFHLAGQMSIAIEALEGLVAITERLKQAQQTTEDMFIESDDNGGDLDDTHGETKS